MDFKFSRKEISTIAQSLVAICMGLMLLLISEPSYSQSPSMNPGDINDFAKILQTQKKVPPLELSDLSNKEFKIYWICPDRRAARDFKSRVSAYVGEQNTAIEYRWSWPDKLGSTDHELPIVVYTSDQPWPESLQKPKTYFRIKIGPTTTDEFSGLQIPEARSTWMDLAAQYMFRGIALGTDGKIQTGERVSYLPPAYLGLDEKYLNQQLDSILQLGLDSAAFPGAEVTIAYKGSVIYQKAVGYHTYDDVYRVRLHDLYDLASLTKVVGGVNAMMTLYEQSNFDLRKNLEEYFPYFKGSDKGDLGMIRILTHSAGLIPYMVYYNMAGKENGRYDRNTLSPTRHGNFTYRVTDSIFVSEKFNRFIYKSIMDSPLNPGNDYKYSGLFFLLIPDLVQKQTGQTMDHFLGSNIFNPIGAANTAFNPSLKYNIHQIVPTEDDQVWRHQLVHGQVHDEASAVLGGISGNAGLFSTGMDLMKIGEVWRRKGQYGGKTFWSTETLETFTRCYYCDEGNRRALGFDRPPLPDQPANSYMSPLASQESYGHSGFTGTMIWVDPAVDYTFVFLSNRVHPTRENTKLYSLNIRPALHSVLYKALEKGE